MVMNMNRASQSHRENDTTATTTTTTTTTTIPISPTDLITRSFHNLSAAASRGRPWPEFAASSAIDRPHSLSTALRRMQTNAKRFRVNYAFLLCSCAAISLLGTPLLLVVAATIAALWLLLYFFREDPLVLWGHQVGDRTLLLVLLVVSMVALWLTNIEGSLVMAAGIGILLCAVHALLMNPDGFFLDEDEAVSANLIQPQPPQPPSTSISV
ncbi:PRA1 family protein G2-like [Humulus lupulus]|uniref:PRA1 family protein G2-like n=1 Tax=Humulus lupulus TaxID=3486 RepID=UPI002B4037A8|nr:PRA1 family protein G2-like [Humulus lupulus]